MPAETITLSLSEASDLALEVLGAAGLSPAQAGAISRYAVAAERDECASHGLYRLLGYIKTARSAHADAKAEPVMSDPAPALVRVDAAKGFAPLALETGLPRLIERARAQGVAAMAVNRCFHLSALWIDVETLTRAGLAGLTVTTTQSYVAPEGGKSPLFGTNPMAFGWPRGEASPYVFDFATSAIARGEIELRKRAGDALAPGWAVDEDGEATTDPEAALAGAMLTFGGYKGSALATMIELLAGPLIGDLTSAQSSDFDGGHGLAPYHGQLVVALDPAAFAGGGDFGKGAEQLFEAIETQGARLPSARRFKARAKSLEAGVALPKALFDDLKATLGAAP